MSQNLISFLEKKAFYFLLKVPQRFLSLRIIFLIALLGLSSFIGQAQSQFECIAPDPSPALYAQMQSEVPAILEYAQSRNRSSLVEIPVYFTIVRNNSGAIPGYVNGVDASDVDAALNSLNDAYDGTGLHFYRLGEINYIDKDLLFQLSTGLLYESYSYVKTALNVYVHPQPGGSAFSLQPGSNIFGIPVEYNTSHVDPLHILNVVDVYIHESGHNFSLLHTFGPASTPQLLYKYPDVLSNPDQSDHPYNGDFPRELVIRDPVSGKNFPLPNCYISGDLCCDTEADASYLYPRVFPAFNPSNIMTCIQASTGCVSGWESSDCVFTGEYRDYNEDLITGCFDNYMALGYHETCTPLKFTAEQKDRISWSFNTYWNGWLEESYINVNDKVELRGTSDPMKNVVIRWRHNNPADRYTNSVSNASGDFQGVLFSQTVKAEVHKIGNDKSLAINNSNYYVDKYTYDEWLEDISTYDLLRIQKHILNLQPLADGYRKIAADVNHSNSITTFDIVELRKLILGIYKKLPQFDAPWRFVPEYIPQDNQVQFDYNPFAMSINSQLISGTPYTEPTWEYSIIDGSNGKSGYDGIKIGDAADPNNPVICDNPPSLQFPQVLLSPNETYDIIFKPQRFNDIAAFQLGFFIDHNKLTVIDVSDSNLPEFTQEENVGMTNLEEDQLAILWFKSNTQGHTLANNDTLFKITVEAKQPIIDLGSAINFNNTSLESIFYTEDGCQESVLMDIEVQQGTGIGNRGGVNSGHVSNTSQNLQKQKMICQPNPTSGQVGIYFDSEEITSGTLLVTDMFGKVVYKISLNVERGINVLTLSGNDIESLPTGILTIILQTQNDMRSVRLVKL